MNDRDLLIRAFKLGHAWNPQFPNLRNLDEGRVLKMSLDDRDAKDMIASLQWADINVERLVAAYHKRDLQPDGDAGPATRFYATMPRCAMPDYAPPPEARFQYDDPDLQKAVESQQQFAEAQAAGEYVGGSGSWPKGCDPTRPGVHSVIVGLNASGASASQRETLPEVLKYVEETEAEIGQAVRHVLDGSVARPQHAVTYGPIPGGVIGFAYFPTPNTCNQVVQAKIDSTFNAAPFVLAELLTHEYKGHSDGLNHTRGGIMNPSIGRPTQRATWFGDPSESAKRRYFGGVAIPSDKPPTPPIPPVPTPSGVILRGTAEVVQNGKVIGTFTFTPAPQV